MLILLAKSLVGAYTRRGRLVHGYDNKRTAHAEADDRQGDLFGAAPEKPATGGGSGRPPSGPKPKPGFDHDGRPMFNAKQVDDMKREWGHNPPGEYGTTVNSKGEKVRIWKPAADRSPPTSSPEAPPSLDEGLKRALFILESPTLPDHANAAGGVDAVRAAISSKDPAEKLAALKRAQFILESPTMPAHVNGGGALDVVRAALAAAQPEPRIALPKKPPPEALPAGHTRGHYVTVVREGGTKAQKIGWLAGPFGSAEEAGRHVEAARKKASEIDPFSDFDAFGTGSRVAAAHPPGVLNDHLGIGKVDGMKQDDVDAALRAHRPDGEMLNNMPRVPGHDSGRREDTSKVWGRTRLTGRVADALRVELEEGFHDDADPARTALRAGLQGLMLNLPMAKDTHNQIVNFVNELSNTADAKWRSGRGTADDEKDAKGFAALASQLRRLRP